MVQIVRGWKKRAAKKAAEEQRYAAELARVAALAVGQGAVFPPDPKLPAVLRRVALEQGRAVSCRLGERLQVWRVA